MAYWFDYIDVMCERQAPGLLGEPVNALTNIAFFIAAAVMWKRRKSELDPLGGFLLLLIILTGLGSLLFHSFASRWARLADAAPIAAFILTYIYAANRYFLNGSALRAFLLTLAFLPVAFAFIKLLAAIPFLAISRVYWPVPVLMLIYAWLLRRVAGPTTRGLITAAALLSVSIVFRSLDLIVCGLVPFGTHFIWHLLNALVMAWVLELLCAHRQQGASV